MAVYTWDRENICAIARRLETEMQNLDMQKENLQKYKAQTAAAYEGEAARLFLADMDADIANMDMVREMIRQQSRKLWRIAETHYKGCEEQLRESVRMLEGEIK